MEVNKKKFLAIHGHFYQPPRENPWLEAILRAMIGMKEYAPSVILQILFRVLLTAEIKFLI